MERSRALNEEEALQVAQALARLREHFKVWPVEPGKEWYLVNFAYYEGCGRRDSCCVEILKACAPLALGQTLVHDHEFEWCMIKSKNSWRFGVRHSGISQPLDLFELDEAPMLHPEHHDEDMEPFEPGEGSHESMHAILQLIGQSVRYE